MQRVRANQAEYTRFSVTCGEIGVAMRQSTFNRIMLRRKTGALWAEADRHEQSNPRLRFRLLRQLLRKGHNDPGLIQNLAEAYAEGLGTRPNRLRAQTLNRKAWRRGSEIAACNAGIDARLDGRHALALLWFRRANAMGSSDALLNLAKLLLADPKGRSEARALLGSRVDRGRETIFDITEQGEQQPCEDQDFAEAKQLLNEVTD